MSETLPPLTAHVVQVTFPSGDGWRDTLRVTSSFGYVRSAIYRVPANGGTQGCIAQADADARTVTASAQSQA